MFRDARSMTGSFSTMINFSVHDFIQRSRKISILNQFKYDHKNSDLIFPIYHKYKNVDPSLPSYDLHDIDRLDIEQIIWRAYDQAIQMVRPTGILNVLKRHDLMNFHEMNKFIRDHLNKSSMMFNYSFVEKPEYDDEEEFELSDEEDESTIDEQDDDIISLDLNDDPYQNEESFNSTKSDFDGIKIMDDINPMLEPSFFRIKINGKIKYLHKQSTC